MTNEQPAEDDGANSPESSLENGSERLIDAVTVGAEGAADNARHIGEQIILLAGAILMASDELKRRMNLLAAILIFVALLSAGATAFQAWETKQLVEAMTQRLQHRP